MPTHEERDAVFSYHFYRLLQRVEEVYLVYNTQNDDFGSGEPSFFNTATGGVADFDLQHQLLSANLPDFNDKSILLKKQHP